MENPGSCTGSLLVGPSGTTFREIMDQDNKIPHACIEMGGLRLRADDDQWILEKKAEGKKGWRLEGYFTKLDIVYQAILELRLRRTPVTTLEGLVAEVKKQRAEVKALLSTWPPDSGGLG